MSFDLDMSEVLALAEDLGHHEKLLVGMRQDVQKSGDALKKRLQAEARGIRSAPGLPAAITYTAKLSNEGVSLEAGPAKGGAGSLAFFYYGNSRIGPRLPDPVIALNAEAQNTEDLLAKAAANVLG